jgi:hypothetical protein
VPSAFSIVNRFCTHVLCGVFVWARRALNSQKRRFLARADSFEDMEAGAPPGSTPRLTMRLEISAPTLESLNGKRQSFTGERSRTLQMHRTPRLSSPYRAPYEADERVHCAVVLCAARVARARRLGARVGRGEGGGWLRRAGAAYPMVRLAEAGAKVRWRAGRYLPFETIY